MATWIEHQLQPGVIRYRAARRDVCRYDRVLAAWRSDAAFALRFSRLLAAVPFDAYLWETPPATRSRLRGEFEFTVTDCPELDRPADPAPFRDRIETSGPASVVRFPNLGGDATLVAPCVRAGERGFSHLASFCRRAPARLQTELWRTVGEAMTACISNQPVWLSTSGLGVAWLHVRLDERPKYYAHAPYRVPPRSAGRIDLEPP